MNITIARHHGMCFGVRDALRTAHAIAARKPVTILGQLVHNPEVDRHLKAAGALSGSLDDPGSATTRDVIITAHGASEARRHAWRAGGFNVTDTTCPLVRKAHDALAALVAGRYLPVVIGQADHVEVRGLVGDFAGAAVVLHEADMAGLPDAPHYGVIAQTTQPLGRVLHLVDCLKRARPAAEVRFIDTVCRPTKQRQDALVELCRSNDLIVVVGGHTSNNTRQLVERARQLGRAAIQIESAAELRAGWFRGVSSVGVTAGTSTLDETVDAVVASLRRIAAETRFSPAHGFLRATARIA
ncbi:MAG: 4-hydroxy-3-methylbut-2-enyl diphosphate reductase [Verrucomicrobiaceae bacterium]|nr:4-hydroxy-3-methylbut-2-enyl diphosphate reductase [Verrucomicrobiaceae bacterium]